MATLNESSQSSDDDDMIEALKEATDSQFLTESLFHRKNEAENCGKEERIDLPKSLRRSVESVEQPNEFGVTQEFMNFVAQQLAKSLDRCVEEIHHENGGDLCTKKEGANTSVGIRLMNNSKVLLSEFETSKDQHCDHNERCRQRWKRHDNSVERLSKCQEVAVQPDWVLSKASTSVWTDSPKGVVYKYKKSSNGTLTEINDV